MLLSANLNFDWLILRNCIQVVLGYINLIHLAHTGPLGTREMLTGSPQRSQALRVRRLESRISVAAVRAACRRPVRFRRLEHIAPTQNR